VASIVELGAMARAVGLAEHGRRTASPNPVVGCVVLDGAGDIVGEGWHERPGGPHAEVVALRAAGSRAAGGTVVVTLEPCSHHGRTPPCTDAIVESRAARVVYAVDDPHPAGGGGASVLRAAGIDVEGGALAPEARDVNAAWLTSVTKGRPHVTLKLAVGLDGRIAAADGTSQWITGPAARADVHRLRARMDAIVVGAGTVAADDPHLTVRLPQEDPGPVPDPVLRVVMGSRGVPAGARVLDDAAPTLVLESPDPAEVLEVLQAREVRSVLVEGGPATWSAFLRARLVDEVVAYLAPVVLGAGPQALDDIGAATIDQALRLADARWHRVGDDMRVTGRPRWSD
jgi:diaminohydroxyphosphoribosylaminopyrimidine deaminase/5-amino-6-(5-phosphoribosylamino)uracil reductase